MASDELLTNRQIVRLAAAISTSDMETVALGYLDLDEAVLKSLKTEKGTILKASIEKFFEDGLTWIMVKLR